MASFKIETGIKSYDIEDENGNVRGQIRFNTADFNMMKRAKKGQEEIEKLLKELRNIDESDNNAVVDATAKADESIKSIINNIFDDENISNVVFGNQSCLNLLNGKTFVERFLTVVMPVVYHDLEEEMKKSTKNIEKYTSQVNK
jgi:hypothetical protein